MTILILAALLAFVAVSLIRTWRLRRNPEAWQPWLACAAASVGIAAVLFDSQIDSALGGTNWVFVLEMCSVYFAYALMTETCRAVGRDAPIELRGWVIGLVASWCLIMTYLFVTLDGRDGTRTHFVREMFPQPQSLGIAVMYSFGVVVLGVLPLYWLRSENGVSVWLIRIGSAMVVVAHATRLIATPIDFFNPGQPGALESMLYVLFVPFFYIGLASFAAGLMGLSLRRWYREVIQLRRHLSALKGIAKRHDIHIADATPIAHLVGVEDAIRVRGEGMLTDQEVVSVVAARSWLARAYDAGSFTDYAQAPGA